MKTEPWIQDLKKYKSLAIKTAIFLLVILLLSLFAALLFKFEKLKELLLGLILGSTFANANVFVLAYAMHAFILKQRGLSVLVSPLLFFLVLSAIAWACAFFFQSLVLGFALGLISPLCLGAVIAYDAATRLTIAGNKAT